jgi:pimeloyl-ACP methyl ester carboxylesterase
MSKVAIRGVCINYRSLGQGQDVVLIHGLAANQGFWSPAVLMPLARNYRVTLIDLRGHGQSSMPAHGYTSKELAYDLQAILQYLGVRNAIIIGHSFGGVVALHTAVFSPELIERLVLADTRIRALQPHLSSKEVLENRNFAMKLKALGLQLPDNEQEAGLWLLEQLAMPKWRKNTSLLQENNIFVPFGGGNIGQGHRAAEKWLQLMSSTSAKKEFQEVAGLTKETIATVRQPVLAIYGSNSSALQSQSTLHRLIPYCQMSVIPESGHFFPLTHPSIFIEKVFDFLNTSSIKDRRIYKRHTLNLTSDVWRNGKLISNIPIRNGSETGLLIGCQSQLDLGGKIQLNLPIIKCYDEPIELTGKIIRTLAYQDFNEYRYGLKIITEGTMLERWKRYLDRTNNVIKN